MSLNIKELNDAAKKVFGSDIAIVVARCPAFGHDDTCIIVSGKNRQEAAQPIAMKLKGSITEETSSAWTAPDGEHIPESHHLVITAK